MFWGLVRSDKIFYCLKICICCSLRYHTSRLTQSNRFLVEPRTIPKRFKHVAVLLALRYSANRKEKSSTIQAATDHNANKPDKVAASSHTVSITRQLASSPDTMQTVVANEGSFALLEILSQSLFCEGRLANIFAINRKSSFRNGI